MSAFDSYMPVCCWYLQHYGTERGADLAECGSVGSGRSERSATLSGHQEDNTGEGAHPTRAAHHTRVCPLQRRKDLFQYSRACLIRTANARKNRANYPSMWIISLFYVTFLSMAESCVRACTWIKRGVRIRGSNYPGYTVLTVKISCTNSVSE